MGTIAHTEAETETLAAKLAATLEPGNVLLLQGNLGAGKTVFARALIRALSGDSGLEVPSPTFTLVQSYDTAKGSVHHFDLYRLKDPEEVYEVGWEDALSDGITIVEWPERLGNLAPRKHIAITISTVPEGRSIEMVQHE